MRILVIFSMLTLLGCGLFRSSKEIKRDSLYTNAMTQQLKIHNEIKQDSLILYRQEGKQAILIVADAPFKWQENKGLEAGPGSYRIYTQQLNKGVEKHQYHTTTALGIKNEEEKKEKSEMNQQEKPLKSKTNMLKFGWLCLLLLVICLWVFSRLKRA